MPVEYGFRELQGKKVLITGEVRAGKTRLTLKLLEDAIDMGFTEKITVIDMGPSATEVKGIKVGGRLSDQSDRLLGVRYLTPQRVETPRLSARSADELIHLVNLNKKWIEPLLNKYVDDPTPILFVNDISIYLQSGRDEPILSAMDAAETFIANGYYGRVLEQDLDTEITKVERRLMEKLAEKVDVLIRL